MRPLMHYVTATALLAGAAWLTVLGALYVAQERQLFPGAYILGNGPEERAALDALASRIGADTLTLTTSDGVRLRAWHHRRTPSDRIVLYVHGNAADLSGSVHLASSLEAQGWHMFAVSLRGFPGSDGAPSQQGMRQDVQAAWDHLTQDAGYAPDHIVLHGRSMGGGVVGQALRDLRPAGVVMESTYDSVRAMAQRQFPWLPITALLRHPFDTVAIAQGLDLPVLQVHSRADRVIPVKHARHLASTWRDGTYIEVDHLGHNQSILLATEAGRDAWHTFLQRVVP